MQTWTKAMKRLFTQKTKMTVSVTNILHTNDRKCKPKQQDTISLTILGNTTFLTKLSVKNGVEASIVMQC